MLLTRLMFGFFASLSVLPAAEIIALSGSELTPTPTSAGPNRYFGSPFTIIITLNVPAPSTVPFDGTGISVMGKATFGAGTDTSVIQSGSATLTEVPGTNRVQWRYRATPTRDGDAKLVILPAVFDSALNATTNQNIILDTAPVITFTSTEVSQIVTFSATIVSGIDLVGPEPLPLNKESSRIVATNGKFAVGSPSILANSLEVKVEAFGIGTISCTAQPGAVSDKWGNTNTTTTKSASISGTPSGGAVPFVTSFIGLSPDNLVYHDGDTINLAVQFSRDVKISKALGIGDPFLTLNSTGSASGGAVANFNPTATTAGPANQLVFTYIVAAGNKAPLLDVVSSNSFTLNSESGVVGTGAFPDALATTALPSPGSSTSLSKNFLYSINVEAAKPDPTGISGGSEPDKCAVGSGLGMMLSLGGLMLLGLLLNPLRRRC